MLLHDALRSRAMLQLAKTVAFATNYNGATQSRA